jgi:hypothetical protein
MTDKTNGDGWPGVVPIDGAPDVTEVPYLDVESDDIKNEILARVQGVSVGDVKRAAIEKVTEQPYPAGDWQPVDAWLKWLHEINGLEYQKPPHPDITETIRLSPAAMRFLFWLC